MPTVQADVKAVLIMFNLQQKTRTQKHNILGSAYDEKKIRYIKTQDTVSQYLCSVKLY